jgi:RNA polymerase sigma-70 factor (ECF subfamily)
LDLPLDEALSRARLGDRDAFEAIYRHAVGRVYALALRLEGRDGEAEDLTQEVFLRVWRVLPSFRGDSTLSTWIHGLAVRTATVSYAGRVDRPAASRYPEVELTFRIRLRGD